MNNKTEAIPTLSLSPQRLEKIQCDLHMYEVLGVFMFFFSVFCSESSESADLKRK